MKPHNDSRKGIIWTASQRVGYLSASQSSREYGRFYGSAPARDIARLRQQTGLWV